MEHRIRSATRWTLSLLVAVVLAVGVLLTSVQDVPGQQSNRAALIVSFGGHTETRCVTFDEQEISGYDVLVRSGLAITADFSGSGTAICAIADTGCPVESCLLCAAPSYWSYWRVSDGSWVYAQLGAGATRVGDRAVEGWSWGGGSPPPLVPFDQICVAPPIDTPPPPTPTVGPPTATPLPAPEAWFRFDDNPIEAGACTQLRWDVSNAEAAYLDGEAVAFSSSRQVCPTAPQIYRLRVVGAAGERSYELTLGVNPTAAAWTPTPPVPTAVEMTPTPRSETAVPTETLTPAPTLPASTASATPSPQPSSTPTMTATPTTSAAATEVAATSVPTTAEPTPIQPTPAASTPHAADGVVGLAAFGIIAGGLLGWLILRSRRGGS